jgi:CPA2 family monovalent cation:H+ antiporter-2
VLKGLTDKGEIDTPHGRLATGVLIFQDLCVVPIMLLLPFLAGRGSGGAIGLAVALLKAIAIVVAVAVLARTLVPRLMAEIVKTRSRELFLIAVILLGTLTALATAEAGASLALGAFLAGLVISESDYGHQALAELLPFRDVFISLFFVAVGMLVEFDFIRDHPVLTLSGSRWYWAGRPSPPPWAGGPGVRGRALLAGMLVSQIGEFSFVLAKEGRALELIPDAMYQGSWRLPCSPCWSRRSSCRAVASWSSARILPLDRLLPGFRAPTISVAEQP